MHLFSGAVAFFLYRNQLHLLSSAFLLYFNHSTELFYICPKKNPNSANLTSQIKGNYFLVANLSYPKRINMADHPRFGPAGVPQMFRILHAKLSDVPKLLRAEELDAFEYAAVRWGTEPQIKQEDAQALGAEAKKNDVQLSLHGSYFINLLGEDVVVEASKRRLIACAQAAQWMGAYVVVFHPGFYGKNTKPEALRKCIQATQDVQASLKSLGVDKVKLGPETMGRHSQFGSLDEVLDVCQAVEGTQLVVDWSHLHARSGGGLRTTEDFRKIAITAEEKLGTEAVRNMHCHFSRIEYTYKTGERCHHNLDEVGFGPEFEGLAEVFVEFKMRPVVIVETRMQDLDAIKLKQISATVAARRLGVVSESVKLPKSGLL
jgi:deoxyribonuclease-4